MNAVLNHLIEDGYLEEIRRDMIKFAYLQLRDEALAEDVVQEALVAALDNTRDFGGRSRLGFLPFLRTRSSTSSVSKPGPLTSRPFLRKKKVWIRHSSHCSRPTPIGHLVHAHPTGGTLKKPCASKVSGRSLMPVSNTYLKTRPASS